MKKNNFTKAIKTIEKTLTLLELELSNNMNINKKYEKQLNKFKDNLIGMLEDLKNNKITNRYCGMSKIIVDSWDINDLGELIIQAEEAYKKCN